MTQPQFPAFRDFFQERPRKISYINVPTADSASDIQEDANEAGPRVCTKPTTSLSLGALAGFFSGLFFVLILVVFVLWSQEAAGGSSHSLRGTVGPSVQVSGPNAAEYLSDITDPPPLLNLSCGESVEEARRAGCVFDLLSTAWTPAECVDTDMVDEFVNIVTSDGAWPYYYDKEGTQPAKDIERLRSGEWFGQELWSTMRLHRHHCMFTWRRMHIAYNGGPQVDTVIRGLRHTKHCAKMMMLDIDPDKVSGVQNVYFRSC